MSFLAREPPRPPIPTRPPEAPPLLAAGRGAGGEPPSLGSLAFFSSHYAVVLLVLAVLLNRIQHLCRPRQARPLSPLVKLAFRLPSLALLSHTLLSLAHQTAAQWQWARAAHLAPPRLSIDELLWRIFMASCISVLFSTLIAALEGVRPGERADGRAPGMHGAQYNNPFGIVCYAMLCHLYSVGGLTPDKHAWLSFLLDMGELYCLELFSLRRAPVPRLPVSTFFGLAATAHYALAHFSGRSLPFVQSRALDIGLILIVLLTIFLHGLTMLVTEGSIDTSRLVFTRANLPAMGDDYSTALFKLGTACLESTRLSGLSNELGGVPTPLGTWLELSASGGATVHSARALTAAGDTKLSAYAPGGLQREVRTVRMGHDTRPRTALSILASGIYLSELARFTETGLRIMLNLLRMLVDALPLPALRVPLPARMRGWPRRVRLLWHGTNGEARRAIRAQEKAAAKTTQQLIERVGGSLDALQGLERERVERDWERLGGEVSRYAAKGDRTGVARCLDRARTLSRHVAELLEEQQAQEASDGEWRASAAEESETESESGAEDVPAERGRRVVRGGSLAGLQLALGAKGEDRSRWPAAPGPADEDEETDAATLLQLARLDFDDDEDDGSWAADGISSRVPFAQVLMAHLSRPSSSGPLTRARLAQLVPGTSLPVVLAQRRSSGTAAVAPPRSSSEERERRRTCVICLAEERSIICWPCRCLALCDACRDAMASRPQRGDAAGEGAHACPTCRAPVAAYSRVFYP